MIDKLSNLKLEEKSLRRIIDCSYNKENRTRLLTRLKEVQKEIKETKEKLRLEKMIKNGNNNTNKSCN